MTVIAESIFEALAAEQREIEELFWSLLQARSIDAAGAAFRVLSHRLIGLLRRERLLVYPHFTAIPSLRGEVALARVEHAEIETTIAKLRLATLEPDAWFAEAAHLHVQVRELVYSEQRALFPLARRALATSLAATLARDFAGVDAQAGQVAAVSITYEAS